ncbi:MAG: serine/threonine-protein kinase [Myxococcota bacterium]
MRSQQTGSAEQSEAPAALAPTLGDAAEHGPEDEGEDPAETIDGRFRVERTLGRGGMGVVYLVWDTRLERHVALKLVKAIKGDAAMYRSRLEREARALAKLSHPNVVPVFEVGEHEGELYLAMEYVQGQTLRAWRDAEPRPWAVVVQMYIQAARGLSAAHSAGLLHRDFKPDNAIVGGDDRVRVLDFGLARAITSKEPASPAAELVADDKTLAATLTQVGTGIGTPAYMAPEQFLGEAVDERTDVFALCVALYEAVHGRRPFEGTTRFALAQAVTSGAVPQPSGADGVPRWLDRVIARGLQRKKSDRPSSLDAVVTELDAGLRRRRRRAVGSSIVVGLALAGGVGWSASSATQEDLREPCSAAVDNIDDAWNDARRDALAAKSVGVAYATTTLDALATQWRSGMQALCTDGLAPPPYDEGRQCLEEWLGGLERSVELIERGDAQTLLRAPDLLARITPPDGDFCALGPAAVVDPDVWTLAERSREAATVGDAESAMTFAEDAIARAQKVDDRKLTPHLAEAHAAKAEALARSGDFAAADEEFAVAERHAIGGEHPERLLMMGLLWAKVEARLKAGSRGSAHLRRAESLGAALGKTESQIFAGEVAEAAGVVAFAEDKHREAIANHGTAHEIFDGAGRPLLAARALLGVGASHHLLGEFKEAETAFEKAVTIYDTLGVPPEYRNRVRAKYNLGYVALATSDRSGFSHFEDVLEHGSAEEKLEVVAAATNLAVNLVAVEDAQGWSQRAMAELKKQPHAAPSSRYSAELAIGAARFGLLDEQAGEKWMRAAEATARQLSPANRVRVQQAWIAWLNYRGRCDDARRRLEALDTLVDTGGSGGLPGFHQWRRSAAPTDCTTTNTDSETDDTGNQR